MTHTEILIRLSNVHYMVDCGIHSGFPACCVRFYVTKFAWMKRERRQSYGDKVVECGTKNGISYGYVPCPACLKKNNVVKVLPCPPGSNCFYVNETLEGVPILQTQETDRPIAYQLQKSMASMTTSFQAMRDGGIPTNGSAATSMTRSLRDMTRIIERAT